MVAIVCVGSDDSIVGEDIWVKELLEEQGSITNVTHVVA
jgi:hypothetical protein